MKRSTGELKLRKRKGLTIATTVVEWAIIIILLGLLVTIILGAANCLGWGHRQSQNLDCVNQIDSRENSVYERALD